jgi:hypothetical protein
LRRRLYETLNPPGQAACFEPTVAAEVPRMLAGIDDFVRALPPALHT